MIGTEGAGVYVHPATLLDCLPLLACWPHAFQSHAKLAATMPGKGTLSSQGLSGTANVPAACALCHNYVSKGTVLAPQFRPFSCHLRSLHSSCLGEMERYGDRGGEAFDVVPPPHGKVQQVPGLQDLGTVARGS